MARRFLDCNGRYFPPCPGSWPRCRGQRGQHPGQCVLCSLCSCLPPRLPAPTTFLRSVSAGYINVPDQFPRLTAKMVRRHLPRVATAKGHLDRARSNPPHGLSDAVSTRKQHHAMTTRESNLRTLAGFELDPPKPFAPSDGPRSTILHLDYTGPLPDVASVDTRYFQVSCWDGYINIQPLQSLRHEHTTLALKTTVEFFREHGVVLETIRMDNQPSNPLLLMAQE
jgi:hypothetical protein